MPILKENGHQIRVHARDSYGSSPHLLVMVTAADNEGKRKTVSTTLTKREALDLITAISSNLHGIVERH